MDPNEALAQLRDLVLRYGATGNPTNEDHDIALSMARLFDGLDHWLTNGGFLPADWTPNTRAE